MFNDTSSLESFFYEKWGGIWDEVFKSGPSKICGGQTAFKKFEGMRSA